ncbi:hypothetical protein P9112_007844 [Eukaryota sp. TZLM1-RC]
MNQLLLLIPSLKGWYKKCWKK